jgi:hypothetical protein
MPNWCNNTLEITGNVKSIAAFKLKATTEKGDFSFEPFLPLPKELDTGPCGQEVVPELIKKTGYSNWYDRNCAILGTKWDVNGVLEVSKPAKLGYTFDSAWAPPILGVVAISKQYPTLEFVLGYDEPGEGFAGKVEIKGGKVLSTMAFRSRDD